MDAEGKRLVKELTSQINFLAKQLQALREVLETMKPVLSEKKE